tara:strand:+ start:893 stop:1408 length:516 start_codon:yes stop_codon:yes gene_type:complete
MSRSLFFSNKSRIEDYFRSLREDAKKSKKQTPDATRTTLLASKRLRDRLQGARDLIDEYSEGMPADTKKQYMQNVKTMSRMIEGQPVGTNLERPFKRTSVKSRLGKEETSSDRYTRIQDNLLDKKRNKMAGRDPGEEKFKKGGVVKKKTAKKKSIDGIAKRGKTKLKRVKG